MSRQVPMRPEMPIMSWVLSDPPSHKAGHAQQHFTQKWYMHDQAQAGPEGTSKLHKEVAQMPVVYCCYSAFSSQPAPMISWGKEDLGLVYRWFCMMCKHHPKVDSCSTTVPLWEIPEGQCWRGIHTVGRTSSSASGCSLCLEREMARQVIIYQLMGCGQWSSWIVRDLEGTWSEN